MSEISVIMSVGQLPIDWLRQSVESILRQTFTNLEFIIICDTPTNKDIIALLKDYAAQDHRIVMIFNEGQLGVPKSVNKGISMAHGKYIARMDADDISEKKRLKKQYAFMEANEDVVLLGSNIHFIGRNAFLKLTDNIRYEDRSIKAQMLLGNCIAQSSVLIRKKTLDENHLLYDESIKCCEDYRLWEQMMPFGKFACMEEKLVSHRLSELQISKHLRDEMKLNTDIIRGRLQLAWLKRNGYTSFTANDLMHDAVSVLSLLRKDPKVNDTPEYKAFLQYVYLVSKDRNKNLFTPFLNGDIQHITKWNIARLIKRSVC